MDAMTELKSAAVRTLGIGFASNAGSYNLGNGTLNVSSSEYIGGNGSFAQSGGVNSITSPYTNGLYLGFNAGGNGTYTLNGGSLSLPASEIYVGYYGNGVYNQTGGTATATYFTTSVTPVSG